MVATSYWPAPAGDVLGDLVAQLVLRQDREVDLDPGLLGEVVGGQLLDVLHLRVADHEDVDGAPAATAAAPGRRAPGANSAVTAIPAVRRLMRRHQ